MREQFSGLSKLAPWKTQKIGSYVRTLLLKVPREAVGRLGDVQGLIGTVSDPRTGGILSANIEEAFSDGIEDALKKLPVSATFETTFETAVSRVNLMLQRLLGEHGLNLSGGDVHGIIIAQKGRDVAAAVWGRPSLVLFRRGVEGGPKLIDVLGHEQDNGSVTGGCGFTNLITGKISGKDRMVVSNRNLLELLDKKCLQEILSAPRTDTVTMLLRETLLTRHENLDLALLLLDGSGGDGNMTAEDIDIVDGEVQETVREKQVSATMADLPPNEVIPPGVPLLKPKNELNLAQRTGAMKKALSNAKKTFEKASAATATTAMSAGKKIVAASKTVGEKALHAMTVEDKPEIKSAKEPMIVLTAMEETKLESVKAGVVMPIIKNKKVDKTMPAATASAIAEPPIENPPKSRRHPADWLINRWNTLNNRSRYLFLATLVVIFITNVSFGVLGISKQKEQAVADYEKTVSTIRQQIDSAEASMIYRDEDRARRLLDEAAAAVALLPEDNEGRAGTKFQLQQDLETKYAGLRHATMLEAPEVLSTVVSGNGTPPDLRMMAQANNALWATTADGVVFKISTEDGSAESVHTLAGGQPNFFLSHKNGILAGKQDSTVLLSPSGQATPLTISAGDYEVSATDVAAFGARLYLLDATHNRILRFASVAGGYDAPQVYIKDGTDLSKAVSLAIDGFVYVLSSDGKITKLLSGNAEDFAVGVTDPPLVSPVLLRTPDEKSDLYVLDSGQPRVVRFDKDMGIVLAQYESDELRGVTDMIIDETARTILATKGNRVLRFTWTEE
ncbi:MAG: hypothetical protein V1738_06080 [Patescibacteria group bacterium]